jgi:hypothetical protein
LIGLHPGNVDENPPEELAAKEQDLKRAETFNYDASDSNRMNKVLHQIQNNDEVKTLVE